MGGREMNLHPFWDVVSNAEKKMEEGWTVYQQFNCAKCGTKQTMPDEDKFYKRGRCEECGHETDIEKDGCNFMAVSGMGKPPAGA
jgi:DNA-directed RNA polymerase subunit RPC12/RpoP